MDARDEAAKRGSMLPTNWAELEPLVDAALGAPPERRPAIIAELSGGDEHRRAELERLVAACAREDPFLDRPAPERFAALLGDSPPPLPDLLVERYTVTRELGRGGMATVYLARDEKHGRDVAVKVMRQELSAALGRPRFLQEIAIAARLHHPHVVPLYDSGEVDGVLYYVMPYEEGQSLRERLARDGALPVDAAVAVLRDIADALAYAHRQGVVHRDIKPENVLLSGSHAMVTDFGVAKAVSESATSTALTATGVALGTPAYMAPEQATATGDVDQRADIYALGVVAYEMLAGRPPFAGETPQRVLMAHVTRTPEHLASIRPAVPPALAEVVMKCLEKQPADRWQRAEEIVAALESLTRAPASGSHATPSRRTGLRTIAVGVLAAGVLVLGVWRLAPQRDSLDPNRVAVMRFQNLTSADSLDSFGMILADMITNGVSRSEVVTVVPAASVTASPGANNGAIASPEAAARENRAGLVVAGSYFLRGNSLSVQPQIIDVRHGRPVAPIELVTVHIADQQRAILEVLDRVMVVLAARVDARLGLIARVSNLPMSLEAYREFAAGVERSYAGDNKQALPHLYNAIRLDSTSASALLWAAQTEWLVTTNLPKVDSLLRAVARFKTNLAPHDLAYYDWLRAWLDGDAEAALRAARRRGVFGRAGAPVQSALRLNRLTEAEAHLAAFLADPINQKAVWGHHFRSLLLHMRGDHRRERREARGVVEKEGPSLTRTGQLTLLADEARALAALGRLDDLSARLRVIKELDEANGAFISAANDLRWHGHGASADSIARFAEAAYRTALARSPSRGVQILLGETLVALERWDEARAIFGGLWADTLGAGAMRYSALGFDVWPLGYLGIIAASSGDTVEAERIIEQLEGYHRPFMLGTNAYLASRIAAQLGQCDRTITLLRKALREGTGVFDGLRMEAPEYANVRGCQAFQQFMTPIE